MKDKNSEYLFNTIDILFSHLWKIMLKRCEELDIDLELKENREENIHSFKNIQKELYAYYSVDF